MKLSTRNSANGRVISIEADAELDLKAHGVFVDACRRAEYPEHNTIDVDLRRTRKIRASGMAMLLMLRELTGREGPRIRVRNSNPDIRKQLMKSIVSQQLQVV